MKIKRTELLTADPGLAGAGASAVGPKTEELVSPRSAKPPPIPKAEEGTAVATENAATAVPPPVASGPVMLEVKDVVNGMAVQQLADATAIGVVLSRSGRRIRVDFSVSGGKKSQWVQVDTLARSEADVPTPPSPTSKPSSSPIKPSPTKSSPVSHFHKPFSANICVYVRTDAVLVDCTSDIDWNLLGKHHSRARPRRPPSAYPHSSGRLRHLQRAVQTPTRTRCAAPNKIRV